MEGSGGKKHPLLTTTSHQHLTAHQLLGSLLPLKYTHTYDSSRSLAFKSHFFRFHQLPAVSKAFLLESQFQPFMLRFVL